MERKTLTLKRPTIEKESESTEPVIQRRRKQVVINTLRKPNKPTKTTPTTSTPSGVTSETTSDAMPSASIIKTTTTPTEPPLSRWSVD